MCKYQGLRYYQCTICVSVVTYSSLRIMYIVTKFKTHAYFAQVVVQRVHIDGLGRTKEDLLGYEIADVFAAKNLIDVSLIVERCLVKYTVGTSHFITFHIKDTFGFNSF